MAKIKEWGRGPNDEAGKTFVFHCPGCECLHSFEVGAASGPSWTWNGSFDKPTFSPSLHYPNRVCHSFVRDGFIQFLTDSTHKLAGQTVEIPEYEE